ncbi:MAG: hypothetical protein ACR2LQ_07145 [Acidimicrobiales bacterium]
MALPTGWVLPDWLESRSACEEQPIATGVGTVDSGVAASVDQRGLVVAARGGWSLDWWIGAEDGWHIPTREPATRVHQGLIDEAPVVETTMRVPGGEIVHRCYGARAAAGDAVVVEVENRSHVPVALALAVRPYDLASVATLKRAALEGDMVLLNGRTAISLGSAPAFAAGSRGSIDVAEQVFGGTRGLPDQLGEVRDSAGLATLALVYALPHTAVRRVALATFEVDPSSLPAATQVASGWGAHLRRAMRISVPDERLQQGVAACRSALVLNADERAFDDPTVLGCLERWGFADELAQLAERRGYRVIPGAGFVVRGDQLDRRGGALERVATLVASASSTWTWPARSHPTSAPAELLARVRDVLIGDDVDGRVALWPHVDPAWFGQGVEVHDAPVAGGVVSYAVRWHGTRPALLWEAPHGLTLTAPGLDPSWSSTDVTGEALLAPVEPGGGLPGVYGPIEVGARVDEPGRSFG